jgi:hypothetical protein
VRPDYTFRISTANLQQANFQVSQTCARNGPLFPELKLLPVAQQKFCRTFPNTLTAPAMASARSQYLVVYNGTFALLWFTLLIRTLAISPLYSYNKTYVIVGNFAKWVQTVALLDVLHSATGQLGFFWFKTAKSIWFYFQPLNLRSSRMHSALTRYKKGWCMLPSSPPSSKLLGRLSFFGQSCVHSRKSPCRHPIPQYFWFGVSARRFGIHILLWCCRYPTRQTSSSGWDIALLSYCILLL